MQAIEKAVEKALKKVGVQSPTVLEYPSELSHGDFASNAALVAAKVAGKNPRALAEEIVKELGEIEGVEKIEIAGPGFINFHLSRGYFSDTVSKVDESWGSNDHVKGYKVIIEYGQPNPFKPFHIGHLMSITVGEAISRLVEFSGATVTRANYQGDIGPHVAKCIWSLQKNGGDPSNVNDLGNAYVAGNEAYENDEKAKEEIDSINKKLYESDQEFQAMYDAGRKASLAKFEDIYKTLGTTYDQYFFESETGPIGMTMVKDGLAKGIFEESDGAVVYKGEKVDLHTRVFITKKGTPTYETKELGLVRSKYEAVPFDLNVTTVAIEQDEFFKVVEAALAELWPEMKGVYTHQTFGLLKLTTGKMSSRKGNIVTGESLIEDMRTEVRQKMSDRDLGASADAVCDAVAVAAIKYSILKQARGRNIIFDPQASLSFEGDSGPYLQYSYVRAMSLLQKAGEQEIPELIPELIPEFERLLPRFPSIVFRAAKEYEPHYITTYLTQMASSFNSWYASERILGSEHEAYKLLLVRAFAQTMKNGLWLLGIKTPQRM